MSRTAYKLEQRNGQLKLYCPSGNQLNVRLALAGQATYHVDKSYSHEVTATPQGTTVILRVRMYACISE